MKKITIMVVPPGSSNIFKFQLNKYLFAGLVALLLFVAVYTVWMMTNFSSYVYQKEKNKTLAMRYEMLVKEREEDKRKLEKIRKDLADMEGVLGKISDLVGVDMVAEMPREEYDDSDYETKWIGDKLKEYNYITRDSFLRLSTPQFIPVDGWISSRFGKRLSPFTNEQVFHAAVDIVAPVGRKVRSASDGVVINIKNDPALGKVLYVYNRWGFVSIYAHNDKIYRNIGDSVKLGEEIAEVGITGKTTGPHLHFQLEMNNLPVDPEYSGMRVANKTLLR